MKSSILTLFSLFILSNLSAQNLKHDFGVFLGTTNLSSDYGESKAIMDGTNNSGTSFAIAHYLQFYDRLTRWDRYSASRFINHIMVKTEIRYSNSTNLQNFSTASKGNSAAAEKIRAMRGSLSVTNLGTNLEYHLFSLRDFAYTNRSVISPYVSLGVNYSMYNRDISSVMGDWRQKQEILPKGYIGNDDLFLGEDESFSISGNLGTRIKIANNTDVVTQFGYQYFMVDDLEGINTNVPQNTSNDWLVNFQLGLVYRL
ncbi:hypothetical protein DUT90_12425 [Polaribacter sp. WD7]|uniref:THC0290_0291 family protein n=1 Tax=Polaribacter sp. WD7 TaxID=2269061 RepID=UPI000DF43634|nr:hypothetical protein [Polaribacter sp. WD7]RCS26554.1 hypothetical protein DUT90_12425 [Polaribacter sp. WD7]